jgi:hypothetical protein
MGLDDVVQRVTRFRSSVVIDDDRHHGSAAGLDAAIAMGFDGVASTDRIVPDLAQRRANKGAGPLVADDEKDARWRRARHCFSTDVPW